jgi:hypothetical protein
MVGVSYTELARKSLRAESTASTSSDSSSNGAQTVPHLMEYRSLGDSPVIRVLINPLCGRFVERPAHGLTHDNAYDISVAHRPIRVYLTIDTRFLLKGFSAKLRRAQCLWATWIGTAAGRDAIGLAEAAAHAGRLSPSDAADQARPSPE